MRSIREANIVAGQRVILRADWNVPVVDGHVLDTTRIEASRPTLDFLFQKGAKVLVLTHFSAEGVSSEVLLPTVRRLMPEVPIEFLSKDDFDAGRVARLEAQKPGTVVLLENVRLWAGEEENDPAFAESLAKWGETYVNDAFSVSHRRHASVVGLPALLPHYAGLRLLLEVSRLGEVLVPEHPFLIILGGAKMSTKLPLIEALLPQLDRVFIGGKMAVEASTMSLARDSKVLLPACEYTALDADQATLDMLASIIATARTIVWNGPLGKYEDGYTAGSFGLAQILLESKAKVFVGGGDTIEILNQLGVRDRFYFVSLGGGAMLDFLQEGGTIPGLEALA